MIKSIPASTCDFQTCQLTAKLACQECNKALYCSDKHRDSDLESHKKSCEIFKKVSQKAKVPHSHLSLEARVTPKKESKHTPKKERKYAPSKKPLDEVIKQVKTLNNLTGKGEVEVYYEGQRYIIFFDALRKGLHLGCQPIDAHLLVVTETTYSVELLSAIKGCFPEEFTCIIAKKKVSK